MQISKSGKYFTKVQNVASYELYEWWVSVYNPHGHVIASNEDMKTLERADNTTKRNPVIMKVTIRIKD